MRPSGVPLNDSGRLALLRPPALQGVEILWLSHPGQADAPWFKSQYAFSQCSPGSVEVVYRGATHRLETGLIGIQGPGELARALQPRAPSADCILVLADPGVLRAAVRSRFHEEAEPQFSQFLVRDPLLSQRFSSLIESVEGGEDASKQRTGWDLLVERILDHRSHPPRGAALDGYAVDHVRRYLEANYAQRVCLDDLAREAGLSKFHLLRLFHRETGAPPHAFLTSVRVENARRLIGEGLPLADIAADTGFSDQSHLTRSFHRVFGVTPGAYLRAMR